MRHVGRVLVTTGLAVALVVAGATSAGGADPVVDQVSGGAFGAFFEIALGEELAPDESDAATSQTVSVVVNGDTQVLSASDVGAQQVEFSAGPAPEVVLPPEGGGPFTDSLASLAVEGGVFEGEIVAEALAVSTEGALGPAGFATSSATAGPRAEVTVEIVAEESTVFFSAAAVAETASSSCDADLAGVRGTSEIIDGTFAQVVIDEPNGAFEPTEIEVAPEPNTVLVDDEIDVLGVFTVMRRLVVNEQSIIDSEITVNAIHETFEVVDTETGELIFSYESIYAQSRCGVTAVTPVTPVVPPAPIVTEVTFAG